MPSRSCHDLVWGLEVGRLSLMIRVTQNVTIRELPGVQPIAAVEVGGGWDGSPNFQALFPGGCELNR